MDKLEVYKIQLNSLKNTIKYIPEKENMITFLDILNKEFDENMINNYLAFLLDPNKNSVALEVLKKLWYYFNKDIDDIIETERVKVYREYTILNNNRIDILILIDDKVLIGIESKVNSSEGRDQTLRYEKGIDKKFDDISKKLLIYLTRGRKDSSSEEFKNLTYKELAEILKELNYNNFIENHKINFLFQDFILHLEEYMMKDPDLNLSEESKLYLEYKEMIKDLNENMKEDCYKTFEKAEKFIKEKFHDIFDKKNEVRFSFSSQKSSKRRYQQVYKDSWKISGIVHVHFEFHFRYKDILTRDNIALMVDVEGNKDKEFIKAFNEIYFKNELEEEYSKKGIDKSPTNREHAIAYKIYDNNGFDVINVIEKLIDEFIFLAEIIDEVFEILKGTDFYLKG